MKNRANHNLLTIGWREWVCLPGLGVSAIKAKIDTGARTSSLHAFEIERFRRRGKEWVRFYIHPRQKNEKLAIPAEVPLLDVRAVRSSSGHVSERPVIATEVQIYEETWTIELTLANRDQMGFRMLLGRQAIRNRLLIDPGRSYCDSRRIPRD